MINGDPGIYVFFVARQGWKQYIGYIGLPKKRGLFKRKRTTMNVSFNDFFSLPHEKKDSEMGIDIYMEIDGTTAQPGHAKLAVIEAIEINETEYETRDERIEKLRANAKKWRDIWGAGKGALEGV